MYDREEWVSAWGWPAVSACWNWKGQEGKLVLKVKAEGLPDASLEIPVE